MFAPLSLMLLISRCASVFFINFWQLLVLYLFAICVHNSYMDNWTYWPIVVFVKALLLLYVKVCHPINSAHELFCNYDTARNNSSYMC